MEYENLQKLFIRYLETDSCPSAIGSGGENEKLFAAILAWANRDLDTARTKLQEELKTFPNNRIARDLFLSSLSVESGDEVLSLRRTLGAFIEPSLVDSLASSIEVEFIETPLQQYPKITIVTPSYNQIKYLSRCIESVLSQEYPNLEYIVMDGGSTDGSAELLKQFDSKLHYWQSQPDKGHYHAIKDGFERSSGEIMGWINSDDMLHPNGLFNLARAFVENPEVRFVTGKSVAFNERGDMVMGRFPLAYWSRDLLLKRSNFNFPVTCVMQEATYWRRSLWEQAGGLDCSFELAGDYDLWARFSRHAPLYTLDAKTGGFREHSQDQRSIKFWDHYLAEVESVIERELALPYKNLEAPKVLRIDDKSEPSKQSLHLPEFQRTQKRVLPQLPTISVVLSCIESKEQATLSIESLLSNQSANIELTVIDHESSEESRAWLEPYSGDAKLLFNNREGLDFSLENQALQESTGEFMAWMPANVMFSAECFEAVRVIFKIHEHIDWIFGRSHGYNLDGALSWVNCREDTFCQNYLFNGNFVDPFISQECVFWRRSLWERAGATLNTELGMAADLDLWLRFFRHAQLYTINYLFAGRLPGSHGIVQRHPIHYCLEARELIDEEKQLAEPGPYRFAPPPKPIGS